MTEKKVDTQSTESEKVGLAGFVERRLRKYKTLAFLFAMLPVLMAYTLCLSISFVPVYLAINFAVESTQNSLLLIKALMFGFSATVALGLFAFVLLISIVVLNSIMRLKVKTWRGNWYSLELIPWYYHNGLIQLARYTVLPFFTSTPVIIYFYKAMGMKIGRGCVINTVKIQDVCLVELGDYVTIGGSATIFCHYAQKGYMVLAPVKIMKGATIGLKASLMGDVIVGENVTVKAHSAIFPKTRLESISN